MQLVPLAFYRIGFLRPNEDLRPDTLRLQFAVAEEVFQARAASASDILRLREWFGQVNDA